MNIPDHIISFINREPLVLWAGNMGPEGFCDFVRAAGVSITEDEGHLAFYLTKKYAAEILKNLPAKELSLLVTSLSTFESYQFKGEFISDDAATEAEEEQIRPMTERALKMLESQGLNANIMPPFVHGPKVSIKFKVREIFDQTPKQGAGQIISA